MSAERDGGEGHVVGAVSVIIPAFNEEGGVARSVADVRAALEGARLVFEIIVVDDGSVDRTAELARGEGADVLSLPENRGYGAALKAGIARARHDILVITDADGTYPASAIPALLAEVDRYDMVVGARTGAKVAVPALRRPAKWFLRRLASYLAGRNIPDLNSGLRVIKRPLFDRCQHLLPSGFSFTTTITLAALSTDALVRFHPIDYAARIGDSKIRPRHAFDFLILILRTVVYFNPLKIFLPLGFVFFALGLLKFIYDLWLWNLSESALMGLMTAALMWAVGLLADQISRVSVRQWGR